MKGRKKLYKTMVRYLLKQIAPLANKTDETPEERQKVIKTYLRVIEINVTKLGVKYI